MSEEFGNGYSRQSNNDIQQNFIGENEFKNSNKKLISGLILILIISLAMGYYLFTQQGKLNDQIDTMENIISILDDKAILTEKIIGFLEDENSMINNSLNRLLLSQSVDDGIVNDQFFIVKSTFYDQVAIIDIDTQPTMSSQYKGNGNFTTEDRELKKYIINLIDSLKAKYNDYDNGSMTPFEDLTIYVTIKNYDIGTFEKAILTLTGE